MEIFDLSKVNNETLFLMMCIMCTGLVLFSLILLFQKTPTFKSIEEVNKKEREIKNKKGQLLYKEITYEYRLTKEDGKVLTKIRRINTNYAQ